MRSPIAVTAAALFVACSSTAPTVTPATRPPSSATRALALAAESERSASDYRELAERLGLRQVYEDPAHHGDVFYTFAAPDAADPVTRAIILVALDTENPFFTLYVERGVLDPEASPEARETAWKAIQIALEYCPRGVARDDILAVVHDTRESAGYRNGYDDWLEVTNDASNQPLFVDGPIRPYDGLSFQLACRG